MLNLAQINKLKSNWGEKADSLECRAEVRIFDPLSCWECFILAINPEDEDECLAIIRGFYVEVTLLKFSFLHALYNAHGEAPIIDQEYRPKIASEIYRRLTERPYERRDD